MDNFPVIIAEVSVAPSGESFRNTFFFCACFRRFTVGSIKTRQITLWAVGLITTYHDMRPIRLIEKHINYVLLSAFPIRDRQFCLNFCQTLHLPSLLPPACPPFHVQVLFGLSRFSLETASNTFLLT